MKVALIGTGNMGEPIGLNLIQAGHELVVYNRTREKLRPLGDAGASVADSPAAAVRGVEVVITMLANDDAVREVMLDEGAIISALGRGAIHMCTSTISVRLSKELAQVHGARGQGYVAAPVLGRPDAAAGRKLWVLAAGPREQVERCRPLMDAIGRGISVMGDEAWQASLAKISMNFLLASMLEALGEAFALARKSGVDEHRFLDVVNNMFNSPVYANYARMIADKKYQPAGFRVKLGLKDVALALEAGGDAYVPLPLASLMRDQYLNAIAFGQGDADWSSLAEVAARNAGL